jgi:hypothetical protein
VELGKFGLTHIWQGQQENDVIRKSKIIKERCNDIDRTCFQKGGKKFDWYFIMK